METIDTHNLPRGANAGTTIHVVTAYHTLLRQPIATCSANRASVLEFTALFIVLALDYQEIKIPEAEPCGKRWMA